MKHTKDEIEYAKTKVLQFSTGKGLGRERLIIKAFKTNQKRDEFLNKQTDNKWTAYDTIYTNGVEFAAGTYVFVGGRYINIKTIPAMELAHI